MFFRTNGPGIAIESSPGAGRDIIERNLISDAEDNGIQIEGQVIVRNNIIIGGANDGISSTERLSARRLCADRCRRRRAHAADDFNGTVRGAAPDSGAYEHTSATNPGWIPVEEMKSLPAATCP